MICQYCGQQLNEGAVFCGNCGQRTMIPISQPAYQASVNYQSMPQLQPMAAPAPHGGGKAIAAMVLGIIGMVGWLIPIVGFATGIMAIIFGSMTAKSDRKGMAITGIILGSIVVFLSFIAFCLYLFIELARR